MWQKCWIVGEGSWRKESIASAKGNFSIRLFEVFGQLKWRVQAQLALVYKVANMNKISPGRDTSSNGTKVSSQHCIFSGRQCSLLSLWAQRVFIFVWHVGANMVVQLLYPILWLSTCWYGRRKTSCYNCLLAAGKHTEQLLKITELPSHPHDASCVSVEHDVVKLPNTFDRLEILCQILVPCCPLNGWAMLELGNIRQRTSIDNRL